MSWGVLYKSEFSDINEVDWSAEIEGNGFTGTITSMQATSNPLTIEYLSPTEDLYDSQVKGSTASLVVEADSNFQYDEITSSGDQAYKLVIYKAGSLYWQGWIMTENFSEPYNAAPYSVTLSASEGFGLLKNIRFDDDGTFYEGRQPIRDIIINILAKIGIYSFKEFINIYEESMDSTINDSPLDQTEIDVDVFRDKYCYDVLVEILKTFNANIRQKDGYTVIYRPTELVSSTVYGRVFTATTKSSTTLTPAQFIDRPGLPSGLGDTEGGTMYKKSPSKKITISHDYGCKQSWINNYKFEASTYDAVTQKYNGWTYHGSAAAGIAPIYNVIKGEKDGITTLRMSGAPSTTYVSCSFGDYAISASDVFMIEFEYMFSNATINSDSPTLYLQIKSNSASQYLSIADNEFASWGSSVAYIEINETVLAGQRTWKSFSRAINGIPVNGSYTISLFPARSSYSFMSFKNIKFYATADEIKYRTYPWYEQTASRKILEVFSFGTHKEPRAELPFIDDLDEVVNSDYLPTCIPAFGRELNFDYKLGDVTDSTIDNVIEQFQGALVSLDPSITPATAKVDTIEITQVSWAGTKYIGCAGRMKPIYPTGSITTSIDNFISSFSYYWDVEGITLERTSATEFTFTGVWDFDDAYCPPEIGNDSVTQAYVPAIITYTRDYTTDWNTRGGSESTQLLHIIGDELAAQTSRTKQMITLPIYEESGTYLDMLGNFTDILNSIYGDGGNTYTAFEANNYDTFTSDEDSFSAINLATTAYAWTNQISVINTEIYVVRFNLTMTSGQVPSAGIDDPGGVGSLSSLVAAAAGLNELELTATGTLATARFRFSNTSASNYTVTNLTIYRKPRVFVFNKGTYNVADRQWMAELHEII